jgi:hypothetical protein
MHFKKIANMKRVPVMKTILLSLISVFWLSLSANAQAQTLNASDTLFRSDIFKTIAEPGRTNSTVTIKQSSHITNTVNNYIANASKKRLTGFRVRIFFDNKQDAREVSLNLENSFRELYPGVGVYRTYTNPYFKVTVGDFRNRSDAMKLFKEIERIYPSAFIVRETINFPPL